MKTELIKGSWDDFIKFLQQIRKDHEDKELLLYDTGDLWNIRVSTPKTMSKGKGVTVDYDREWNYIDFLDVLCLDRYEVLVSDYCAEDLEQEICEWKNGRLDKNPMEDIEHRYTFELI